MIGIPESLAREPPESPQKLLPVGPTRAPQLPVRSAGVDSADRANATVPLQNLLAKITVAAEARAQAGWMSVSRPPAPASVARNDARIGERAATRGRSATEGDDEHGAEKDQAFYGCRALERRKQNRARQSAQTQAAEKDSVCQCFAAYGCGHHR